MLSSVISSYFSKYNKHFSSSLLNFCDSMFLCSSSNSWEVARQSAISNDISFKTAEMRRYRLLSNKNFTVDDSIFRCNINILYDILKQNKLINKGDNLLLALDFTSSTDKFLILSACMIIDGNSYPIYFSIRGYPKEKGRYNHKKMEEAFMKGLKHLLSKDYKYTILADRGFGNQRFIELCEKNNFDYVIRMVPNMNGKYDGDTKLIRNLLESPGKKRIAVKKWKKDLDFYLKKQDENEWFMVSNLPDIDEEGCAKLYEKRFKIEKIFQNLKSSGFDIEASKITQYSKFKRLLFCCFLCYNVMILTGDYINRKKQGLKKNSSICENLILAFSASHEKLSDISQEK